MYTYNTTAGVGGVGGGGALTAHAPRVIYSAKTGDNDCNVNPSRYSLSTALCSKQELGANMTHVSISSIVDEELEMVRSDLQDNAYHHVHLFKLQK